MLGKISFLQKVSVVKVYRGAFQSVEATDLFNLNGRNSTLSILN